MVEAPDHGRCRSRSRESDAEAAQAVFAWLRRVDALFSTYRAGQRDQPLDRGELAIADADPLVREVLARCERLREETGRLLRRRGRAAGSILPAW